MIAVIDYDTGNLRSVANALGRLGAEYRITASPDEIRSAERVLLPGVGEASTAMEKLRERGLVETIRSLTQPVLGICIGMQLMCRHSEEGDVDCLGIFNDVDVKRFRPENREQKVPHMGWNTVSRVDTQMFPARLEGQYVYFVHSYYAPLSRYTTAVTEYIQPFSAALHRDNFYATQFHIEKSGTMGEEIFNHFLSL